MSWLQTIQNKPQAVKIKIMWVVGIVAAILLIFVWIISYKFNKSTPPDTTLFNTIGQGVHNVKQNYGK
jgi:uncharacterized membrane protein YqiK